MKSKSVWWSLVCVLLVHGMIGDGDEPEPVVEKLESAAKEPKAVDSKPDVAEKPKAATDDAIAARKEQEECSQRLGSSVEITNSIGMKLRLIPPGEFMMGSPDSDRDARDDEKPQHKVKITKPFYLGVYEVTQAEYERVMGANPSHSTGASKPVESVSWNNATEFCKRLSAKEGKTYRLPTEAEWEYACRAGTTTRYSFGDDLVSPGEHAWRLGTTDVKTHPVGEKKPNAWGLYDMHWNVWEWCQDWYDKDYHAVSPTDDPPGPETATSRVTRGGLGLNRVVRGGGWDIVAQEGRSAVRGWHLPGSRARILGFRVAAVPSDSQSRDTPVK